MADVISGIPVYSKDELRVIQPTLGQRYAVRESGGLRGPYEITWLENRAYRGDAVRDVPGFPYQWIEPKPMDPERVRAINEQKKHGIVRGSQVREEQSHRPEPV